MMEAVKPDKRPLAEVAAAQVFYAALGQETGYFPALWHTLNVGHMLAIDLDRICRKFGLSLAEFNLMGALRIERLQQLRATDLAKTLQVSNGALTDRIAKLAARGMLIKLPAPGDRRAFRLDLTPAGAAVVDGIHSVLPGESHFVQAVSRLPASDRAVLERIMGELQGQLDRHFIHVHR